MMMMMRRKIMKMMLMNDDDDVCMLYVAGVHILTKRVQDDNGRTMDNPLFVNCI